MNYSRFVLLLPLALTACGMFGLSDETRERVTHLKESAALFYDTERYGRALDLAQRGLELSPDDYKLRAMQAWCYLKRVDVRPEYLATCERLFDELSDMRSQSAHGQPALLGLGETQKRLASRHLDQARALEREILAAPLPEHAIAVRKAKANEHQERARHHLARATRAFEAMLTNEMDLRTAHSNLMEIAWARNDYDRAIEHGLQSLEHNLDTQRYWATRIDQTMDVGEEHEARRQHQQLVESEVRTRSLMVTMHYAHKDFDAALVQLDAVLRIDPTRSADYYNRARVHEELGHVDEARRDYRKFLLFPYHDFSDEKVKRAFEYTKVQPMEATAERH